MGLGDQINDALEAENNGELLRLRKQRDSYANQNVRLQTKLDELERALSVVDQVDGLTVQPPRMACTSETEKPCSHTRCYAL
jgi:hypothetical protein